MRAIVDDALADQVRRLERERDKLAAQLATLRSHSLAFFDAVANLRRIGPPAVEGTSAEIDAYCDSMEALESALTAPAPAVETHTRRVQAEALDSAADVYCEEDDGEPRGTRQTCAWLRRRAADLRGGR